MSFCPSCETGCVPPAPEGTGNGRSGKSGGNCGVSCPSRVIRSWLRAYRWDRRRAIRRLQRDRATTCRRIPNWSCRGPSCALTSSDPSTFPASWRVADGRPTTSRPPWPGRLVDRADRLRVWISVAAAGGCCWRRSAGGRTFAGPGPTWTSGPSSGAPSTWPAPGAGQSAASPASLFGRGIRPDLVRVGLHPPG